MNVWMGKKLNNLKRLTPGWMLHAGDFPYKTLVMRQTGIQSNHSADKNSALPANPST